MSPALAALLIQAGGAAANPTHVDQLVVPNLGPPARRVPAGPEKRSQAASIAQLPGNINPVAEAREEMLAEPPPTNNASSRASAEVARAAGVIRARGQQITPELLAREVGPEVLETYLAHPDAALPPTGLPSEATPTTAPIAGVTIIPPVGKP